MNPVFATILAIFGPLLIIIIPIAATWNLKWSKENRVTPKPSYALFVLGLIIVSVVSAVLLWQVAISAGNA